MIEQFKKKLLMKINYIYISSNYFPVSFNRIFLVSLSAADLIGCPGGWELSVR